MSHAPSHRLVPRKQTGPLPEHDLTRDEVLAAIDSGLPILRDMAESEGAEAVAELHAMHDRALSLVPAVRDCGRVADRPGES